MKISLSISEHAPIAAPFVLKGPWIESIKIAKSISYEAVEMHIRDPKKIPYDAIKQALDEQHLSVSSIGTGLGFGLDGLSLSHPDDIIRTKAISRIFDHIDLATSLNACVIIGTMKGLMKEHSSYTSFIDQFTKSIETLLVYAKEKGVTLVLEAINRYESDTLHTLEAMGSYIRTFNSPFLKLHIDVFHMNMEEKDIVSAITHAKDIIGHVHVADNNRHYPGGGCFNFGMLIDTLKVIDYKGYLAIESLDLPDPITASTKGFQYLKALL